MSLATTFASALDRGWSLRVVAEGNDNLGINVLVSGLLPGASRWRVEIVEGGPPNAATSSNVGRAFTWNPGRLPQVDDKTAIIARITFLDSQGNEVPKATPLARYLFADAWVNSGLDRVTRFDDIANVRESLTLTFQRSDEPQNVHSPMTIDFVLSSSGDDIITGEIDLSSDDPQVFSGMRDEIGVHPLRLLFSYGDTAVRLPAPLVERIEDLPIGGSLTIDGGSVIFEELTLQPPRSTSEDMARWLAHETGAGRPLRPALSAPLGLAGNLFAHTEPAAALLRSPSLTIFDVDGGPRFLEDPDVDESIDAVSINLRARGASYLDTYNHLQAVIRHIAANADQA